MNIAKTTLLSAFALLLTGSVRAQSLGVYLNAPRTSNSIFSNTTVETFNTLPTGNRTTTYNSAIGNYLATPTNPMNIEAGSVAWSWDGTVHIALGAQSGSTNPVSLVFATPQTYFGFGWAAGDPNNRMTFYSGGTALGTFASSDIQNILSGPTVQSIDNTTYNTSNYRGQPANPTVNPNENYAFVNFIASGGLTFDRIDFYNMNTGTGFESDNHTILASGTATPQGSFVAVSTISGAAAPEPATIALLVLGALPAIGLRRRA